MSWILKIILHPKFILDLKNGLLLMILLSLLPLQHIKFGLLIGVILLYIFILQYKKVRPLFLVFLVGGVALLSGTYLYWMYRFFGGYLFEPMKYMSAGNSFKLEYIFSGLLGSLIDRENGILLFSPLYVYIFIGFSFLFKNYKKIKTDEKIRRIFLAGMIIIQTMFVTMYPHLLGGQNPAGRYFLPIIPAVIIVLAITFEELLKLKIQKIIITIFTIYTCFISIIIMSRPTLVLPYGGGNNLVTFVLKDHSVIVHKALPNLSKFERTITNYDYVKGISIFAMVLMFSFIHLVPFKTQKRGQKKL
jgi:hypothetical protein